MAKTKMLTKLRIDECSAVDSAANPFAKVVLMKRHVEPEPTTLRVPDADEARRRFDEGCLEF
jgi:hypothetical protein